jgi:hypothetical protein
VNPTDRPRRDGAAHIPDALAAALRRAHAVELRAIGAQRRPALRLTRSLLGGSRLAGYHASQLAECLGVSVSSIRNRGGSDGWVDVPAFTRVAGVPMETVEAWRVAGLLTATSDQIRGEQRYLASELVRALTGSRSVRS